ncbi:MAG: hypothetical protein ABIK15_08440 [Pseudomonadota bacterium]
MSGRKNNFIWLFSFADLAFLLLISFSQIPGTRIQKIPLPKVPQENGEQLIQKATTHLRLFIFETILHEKDGKPKEKEVAPFQLVTFRGASKIAESGRIPESQLLQELKERFRSNVSGPVLWPHPSARAEDLLTAYVLIQQVWKNEEVVIAVTPKDGNEGQSP